MHILFYFILFTESSPRDVTYVTSRTPVIPVFQVLSCPSLRHPLSSAKIKPYLIRIAHMGTEKCFVYFYLWFGASNPYQQLCSRRWLLLPNCVYSGQKHLQTSWPGVYVWPLEGIYTRSLRIEKTSTPASLLSNASRIKRGHSEQEKLLQRVPNARFWGRRQPRLVNLHWYGVRMYWLMRPLCF